MCHNPFLGTEYFFLFFGFSASLCPLPGLAHAAQWEEFLRALESFGLHPPGASTGFSPAHPLPAVESSQIKSFELQPPCNPQNDFRLPTDTSPWLLLPTNTSSWLCDHVVSFLYPSSAQGKATTFLLCPGLDLDPHPGDDTTVHPGTHRPFSLTAVSS